MQTRNTPKSSFQKVAPGAALAVAGSVLALGGGGVLAAFGTDGKLTTGRNALSSPANAIVTPVAGIRHTSGVTSLVGRPTLRVSVGSTGAGGAFVGIAPAGAVDRYLAGASTAAVKDLGEDSFTVQRPSGAGRPNLPPPGTRGFWVARASAASGTAAIDWKIRDGRYRLVTMRADGRPGVATRSAVTIGAPRLPGIGLAVLLLGIALAGGGILLATRASGPGPGRGSVARPAPIAV